ncbi:GNAT family N-acetyltransferase [Peribacillus sp. SCS-26]|uniref:GNAT family N-acetyltransferase n=1 Tax=Paraperibacillus marinus TaxID=3115295 RepID=UPI00390693A1
MNIIKLGSNHNKPMKLLLLADPSERSVRDYLNRGDCYAILEAGEILGVYVLLPTRPETAELVNIAVEEKHQGKGIGRKLVIHAISEARSKGFKTIEIGTGNSSVGQLAFYQKCGFRIMGVDFDFFMRHYEEEIYENGIHCRDMIRLSMDL